MGRAQLLAMTVTHPWKPLTSLKALTLKAGSCILSECTAEPCCPVMHTVCIIQAAHSAWLAHDMHLALPQMGAVGVVQTLSRRGARCS